MAICQVDELVQQHSIPLAWLLLAHRVKFGRRIVYEFFCHSIRS